MSLINSIKIAEHFLLSEFECPCCNRVMVSPDLLRKLEVLRMLVSRPIYISSGYRCNKENIKVGGVKNSYHKIGLAVDVYVKDYFLSDLLFHAQELGFNGIGFYEKENFLHLDVRSGQKRFWKGKDLIGY